MSYSTDSLAGTIESLVRALSSGRKSIAIKTGVHGGKMLTIVETPKS